MASAWDRFTLFSTSPHQWQGASYLYRFVGIAGRWRQSSWLLQWSELIGAGLLSIIFLLGPFVTTGLIGLLLTALAIYWLILTLSDERTIPRATPIHLLVWLYWSIAAIAVAFSPVKIAALSGWGKLSLFFLMFMAAARFLRSPKLAQGIITAILLVGLVVSSYGIRQQFMGVEQLATWNDPTSEMAGATRVYSYLGNPNLLASYLLPIFALSLGAVFAWRTWPQKALALTMVAVNGACLFFTQSRGGWIGVLLLSLTFLLLLYLWWQKYLPIFWQKWLLPLVLWSLVTLIVLALVSVEPLRIRVMSIFAGRKDSSNNFRLNVWSSVADMIRDRPILGIGPGNTAFKKIYPLYMQPKYSALSAYSIYLETLVETGIIGFGVFLWLIVTTINLGIRQIQTLRDQNNPFGFWLIAAIAGIVGILSHGFVDTVWYRPQINTLWWFLIALIASQYPVLPKIQAEDPSA
jgi:putative inorganic carbon (HCO3(-)) transporter